jgi:hypothetical protein
MNLDSMTLDPALAAAAASLLLVLLPAVLLVAARRRSRTQTRGELECLRASFEREKITSAEALSELKKGLGALENQVRSAPEAPQPGGLNRSARAEALRLLRSGMSPETAAASLGMGKREMRLLERVSRTFWPL